MKRSILAAFAVIFSASFIFAESYQIADDVKYESTGMTREYALKKAVEIDHDRVFTSYEELNAYISDIQSQFNNERVLSNAIINKTYDSEVNEDGIQKVHLRVLTTDSNHFLAVPYPKYKSGDGLTLKVKMKDTNFLGTMEEMNFDINYKYDEEKKDNIFGINFDYSYPFEAGPFDISWNNKFSLDYTIGETKPEYSATTGFTVVKPFKGFDLQFDVSETITENFDYTYDADDIEQQKFLENEDDLYYTTDLKLSVPVTVANIDGWGKVKYTPYIGFTINYDNDGINELNDDLSSPVLTIGHGVSTSRINWQGNFRKGISFELGQSVGYNYQREEYIPSIEATVKGYYAWKYIGVNSRLNCFAMMNGTKSIGSDLRGIRDDQYYKKSKWDNGKYAKENPGASNKKALNTPSAIVFSLDIPVHIVTTDWVGWCSAIFGNDSWITDHFRWARIFDFELQIAPFGDLALTYNYYTGKAFSIPDGWYAGGVEVLVFPAKWRSLVVRASAGMDAGRKIVDKAVDKLFDNSWRTQCSALELYIGIGLQY